MGAAMRVYYEHSDSSSSDQSSSEEEEVDDGNSSGSSKDGSKKKAAKKKNKNKNELLSTGLVYQPKFPKIITDSGTESLSDAAESGQSSPAANKQKSKALKAKAIQYAAKDDNIDEEQKEDSVSNSSNVVK